MSIITLTTDYGNKDYSVSELKAKIYNEISDVRIVDVSHNISPFNLTEAAYIIKSAYRHFPEGSIHIIGVESDLTPENAHMMLLAIPFTPSRVEYLILRGRKILADQMEFLISHISNKSPIFQRYTKT